MASLAGTQLKDTYEFHYGEGNIIRALFARLKPHGEIPPHIDGGTSLEKCRRTHIPIITNEKNVFKVGPEIKHLKVGEIWEIDNTMQSEIKSIKNNVKYLETMIDFTNKLDDNLKNDDICKEIIEKINEFTSRIEQNSKFKEAKENYSKKRVELNKYFDIIKSLNNLNVSNTCPLCLTNKIDLYINPCGHCCCMTCKDRLLQYENSMDSNCFICRKRINSFNGIYLS